MNSEIDVVPNSDITVEFINNELLSGKLENFYLVNNLTRTIDSHGFDFSDIIYSSKNGENMDMAVIQSHDRAQYIIFYISKENNEIISSLIMEQLYDRPMVGYEVACYDISGNKVCEGFLSATDNIFQVTDLFLSETRASAASWGCNMSLGAAGGILSLAAGAATGGVGAFAVGMGWCAFQTWICGDL